METAGFLLVIFAATMGGNGSSVEVLPTVYETKEACLAEVPNLTFDGEAFGLRLDSVGKCVKAGSTLLAPVQPVSKNTKSS